MQSQEPPHLAGGHGAGGVLHVVCMFLYDDRCFLIISGNSFQPWRQGDPCGATLSRAQSLQTGRSRAWPKPLLSLLEAGVAL